MDRVLYIKHNEYANLNTKQKIKRASTLARLLNDFNSGVLSDLAEKRAMTTLIRYMFSEDLNYMTKEELDLFRSYKLIKE